jgi:ATPase subunit of ABC transporter with duplicated ATPase domains
MHEIDVFSMVYPEKSILRRDTEQSILDQFYKNFNIERPNKSPVSKLKQLEQQNDGTANLQLEYNGKNVQLKAWCGHETKHPHMHEFIPTSDFETFLAELALTHASGVDFCILGDKGSGKSTIITEFAKCFGYATETIALYNDLNSRDLLQRRRILPNGDTVW